MFIEEGSAMLGDDSARAIECPVCGCKAYELICFTESKVYIKQVAMHASYKAREIGVRKVTIRVCPFELDARHKLLENGKHYTPETALAMKKFLYNFQLANSFYNSTGPILEYIGIEKIARDVALMVGGGFADETQEELIKKFKKLFKLLAKTDSWVVDQIYIDAKGAIK